MSRARMKKRKRRYSTNQLLRWVKSRMREALRNAREDAIINGE